jgi:alkylhydroperoxidase family enzyme
MEGRWDDVVTDAATRALCAHALRLTREPWAIAEGDLDELRRAGLDDRAILDLTLVVAYYNFVNRLASGLCVELEP